MIEDRIIRLALLICMCCSPVIASEEYIVSATTGLDLVLKTIVLDQGIIKTKQSSVIPTHHPIFNTAVTSRKLKNSVRVFDVYYATCLDPNDIFCDFPTLSITRFDSKMNVEFTKDFDRQTWIVSTESIQQGTDFESRVFLYNGYSGRIAERKLRDDGSLSTRIHLNSEGGAPNPIAAEDGRMAAGTDGTSISVWFLRANSPGKGKHTDDYSRSVALSGPISRLSTSSSAPSSVKSRRFLFFRTYRDLGNTPAELFAPKSRILRQQIDDSTGKFIGQPKVFIDWEPIEYVNFSQSVAVTPKANLVLYIKDDQSCKKQILMAQVYEPLKKQKVGPPQVVIGCSEVQSGYLGVQGIDIAPAR